jgi:hypothetical protein
MTRRTSIEAYERIKREGLLKKAEWEIYDTVYKHGPMTSGDAFLIINGNSPRKCLTQSRARFTGLRDKGVLEEVGEGVSKSTGYGGYLWDVTDDLPRKVEKKLGPTRKEVFKAMHDLLDEMTDYLGSTEKQIPERWKKWNDKALVALRDSEQFIERKSYEKKAPEREIRKQENIN